VREESDEFEQGTTTAANPARELTTEGSGESAQSREVNMPGQNEHVDRLNHAC
jgi:hypothetical protein